MKKPQPKPSLTFVANNSHTYTQRPISNSQIKRFLMLELPFVIRWPFRAEPSSFMSSESLRSTKMLRFYSFNNLKIFIRFYAQLTNILENSCKLFDHMKIENCLNNHDSCFYEIKMHILGIFVATTMNLMKIVN